MTGLNALIIHALTSKTTGPQYKPLISKLP